MLHGKLPFLLLPELRPLQLHAVWNRRQVTGHIYRPCNPRHRFTVTAVVGGVTLTAVLGSVTVTAAVGGVTVTAAVGGVTVTAAVGGVTVTTVVGGVTES